MDINEKQTPPAIQEAPIISKHFHLPRVLLILLLILVVSSLSGYVSYNLGKEQGLQQSASSNAVETKISSKPITKLSIQSHTAIIPTKIPSAGAIVPYLGIPYTTNYIDTSNIATNNWTSVYMPFDKLSVSYPPNWKMSSSTNGNQGQVDTYDFTSPDNFQITISLGVTGLGGGCDNTCVITTIPNVDIGSLTFDPDTPLFIYVTGESNKAAEYNGSPPYVQFSVGGGHYCVPGGCYGFRGKYDGGQNIIIGGFLNTGGKSTYTNMAVNQFISSNDVVTAVALLKTMHY